MNINILEYLNYLLKGTHIHNLTLKKGAAVIKINRSHEQVLNQRKNKPVKSPVQTVEKKNAPQKENNLFTLKANTVGVFYRGKTKLSPALVKTGSEVKKGTQVGIVDCMGVIEKISSTKSGIIKEVLAENHKPVEYGQPLFIIEIK